jgi:aminoglycoside phosphotransferase (APT) family kinase protein
MERCCGLGFLMPKPLEFGEFDGGVYTLQTWLEGEDAGVALTKMSEAEQYALGVKAGEILLKIHAVPAPQTQEPWEPRFSRKVDRNIRWYNECPQKPAGGDKFLRYLAENRHLLRDRPQCLQHGDYHVGNMIVTPDGDLGIIDFDRPDYGDPWEEFNRIAWCAQTSGAFASGRVDGYFGGEIPLECWCLLAFYIASNMLSSVYWAIPFGREQVDIMNRQAADVLEWFGGMERAVPAWYDDYKEKIR